jgi:hypothetical protein
MFTSSLFSSSFPSSSLSFRFKGIFGGTGFDSGRMCNGLGFGAFRRGGGRGGGVEDGVEGLAVASGSPGVSSSLSESFAGLV